MGKIDRRKFLQILSLGTGYLGAKAFISPKLLMAAAPYQNSKNIIVLNLAGGLDDLYTYPVTGASERAALATVRAPLMHPDNQILPLGGAQGMCLSMIRVYGEIHYNHGDLKLVGSVGFPDGYSRSHYTSQRHHSMLNPNASNSNATGWINRVRDNHELDQWAIWGLATGQALDFSPARNYQPIIANNLSDFSFYNGPIYSSEMEEFKNLHKSLLQVDKERTPMEEKVKSAMLTVHDAMPYIQQISSVPLNGNYGENHSWKTLMQDSVKTLIKRASEPETGNSIVLMKVGGFDTHAKQLYDGNLPDKLSVLSNMLAGAAADLRAIATPNERTLWDDTIIIVQSEFGRKTVYNGEASDIDIDPEDRMGGCDHGSAYTSMLLGGDLHGGPGNAYAGIGPSVEALTHSRGYREPLVDVRNIYTQVLNWAGFNAQSIIPGNWNYNLDLFNS